MKMRNRIMRNRKRKRCLAILISVWMGLGLLSGCGASEKEGNAGSPVREQETEREQESKTEKPVELTFVSANNTHGISLDPAVDYCGARNVYIGVCETLFRLEDETLEVKPHLVSEYEQIDDCTWKLTLRNDVYFSNGKKMTAADAKASLEYETAGIARIATLLDLASIEADGQVLTITTNDQVATLPRLLTDVSTQIFDPEGSEDYANGVIGSGPYILEQMDADGNCELVKNENYWQGEPAADRIHTKFIPDNSATTMALQSGELDWASIPAGDVALFENNEDYQIMEYETGRVYFLYLNSNYTFTKDPALREALTYAFDREAYLKGVYDGRGNVTQTIFPQWSGYSNDEVRQVSYDPDTAKKLLADAGYVDENGDGFLEKDGEKVTLTITCYANNGFNTLSEVIQASLKQLGIDSNIVVSEAIVDDLTKGQFNIATYGYTTLTMGDCYNFLEPVFRTGASSNFNQFSNEKVDALLDEMKAVSDTEKRKELAIEIQKEIYASDEHIFLLHISTYKIAKAEIKNLTTGLGDNFNLWKVTK